MTMRLQARCSSVIADRRRESGGLSGAEFKAAGSLEEQSRVADSFRKPEGLVEQGRRKRPSGCWRQIGRSRVRGPWREQR